MYHGFSIIAAATTPPKISEKYTYAWFSEGNLRILSSSRIMPLLTKAFFGSCHIDQDQIAEGLLLEDRHRNYRLGTPFLYKRGSTRGIWT
jgi:hypothetical protein